MTEPFHLSSSIAIWRKRIAWYWDKTIARVPERLRLVDEGRPDEGAPALADDLGAFALVQPAAVATHLGALAPSLDATVAQRSAIVGSDKPVGIYEISLANVGNVFDCLGFAMADATWATVRHWLPRFEVSRNDPLAYYYWNAGLIAIALGQPTSKTVPFQPGATFQMNVRGLVDHFAGAVEANATADDVMPAFLEVIGNYPRLASGKALDESSLLWIARIVHHQLGKQPLATTAQFLHDTIWELAEEPA